MATATEYPQGSASSTPNTAAIPLVPEPGQVVKVRGSTWAVSDIQKQGLPRSPADEGAPRLTHVVSVLSLDADRLGQKLTVVWELEVGHTVAPNQGLPETVRAEAFDDPNTLAAFVDAVRWGAVDRIGHRFAAGVRHQRELRVSPRHVCFAREVLLRDEQREVGVVHADRLDAPVDLIHHAPPQRIARRPDHHRPAHRPVVGQLPP